MTSPASRTHTSPAASSVPEHVAIIMDGNGRWARVRGLERSEGHIEGVKAVRRTLDAAVGAGVRVVTLYTFSEENWNRPPEEVDALMTLLLKTVRKEVPELIEKKIRLRVIGDLSRIPDAPRLALEEALGETDTPEAEHQLVLALNYSARTEILRAAEAAAREKGSGRLTPEDLTRHLYAPDLPFPDLLIRTGGELRISNFLLWQLAYSELYFTETYWPDFGEEEFRKALTDYAGRQRRFGRTGEQIEDHGEQK